MEAPDPKHAGRKHVERARAEVDARAHGAGLLPRYASGGCRNSLELVIFLAIILIIMTAEHFIHIG